MSRRFPKVERGDGALPSVARFDVALFGSREATIACSLGRKPKVSREKGNGSREAATAVCAAAIRCRRFAALGVVASNPLGLRPRLRAVATTFQTYVLRTAHNGGLRWIFQVWERNMGVRDAKKEAADRLSCKTLDDRFHTEITLGLNCSPFEAEAVLQVVKEVYFPFLDEASPQVPPGKISVIAVCADEPAGKPIAQCQKRAICLTHEDWYLRLAGRVG